MLVSVLTFLFAYKNIFAPLYGSGYNYHDPNVGDTYKQFNNLCDVLELGTHWLPLVVSLLIVNSAIILFFSVKKTKAKIIYIVIILAFVIYSFNYALLQKIFLYLLSNFTQNSYDCIHGTLNNFIEYGFFNEYLKLEISNNYTLNPPQAKYISCLNNNNCLNDVMLKLDQEKQPYSLIRNINFSGHCRL